MTTAATSLLGLALPVTGELAGTWGDTVNNSITSLLDSAVAGTTTLSTDGDVTLTTTTLAANQARQAILLCSGARTALRTITAPAQSKIYTVINATTGGYSVKLVGAGPTTGVTIVAGESAVCAWNGSDFIKISNTGGSASFTNVTVSGTTTLSGLTASTALALDASKNVVSVTNTGTGNNVLSASPTLTGTVGAAALTLSSDLTLSGGTANGVLYLNGSKVATSGSALTYNGVGLGIGVASATQLLNLSGAGTSNIQLVSTDGGGKNLLISVSGSLASLRELNGNPLGFDIGGSEQMRLTSTGLGIGTSSPAYKLDVSGIGRLTTAVNANATSLILNNSNSAAGGCGVSIDGYSGNTSNKLAQIVFGGAGATGGNIDFLTSANGSSYVQQMRLDTSGNLLVGTTTAPSGASIGLSVVKGGGIQFGGATGGGGALVGNSGGGIQFYGYAGNQGAENYSERMRLDASGNLGLGVTPSAWNAGKALQIAGTGLSGSVFMSDSGVLMFSNNYRYSGGDVYNATGYATRYYQYAGQHIWNTAPSGTAGNAITFTQAMTLDASSNLAVGTTATGVAKLNLGSGSGNNAIALDSWTIAKYTGTEIQWGGVNASNWTTASFYTGGSERARIDSSGNFLIGTTTQTARLNVTASSSNRFGIDADVTARNVGDEYGLRTYLGANNSTSGYHLYGLTGGTLKYYVNGDGSYGSATNSYGSTSDVKLKENIVDATPKLSDLMQVRIRNFNLISDESKTKQIGVIAQELEQVFPSMVEESPDRDAEGNDLGTTTKSVKYSVFVPMLIKAMQEQQAQIESLRKRLADAGIA